jgi:hypothetical protein
MEEERKERERKMEDPPFLNHSIAVIAERTDSLTSTKVEEKKKQSDKAYFCLWRCIDSNRGQSF